MAGFGNDNYTQRMLLPACRFRRRSIGVPFNKVALIPANLVLIGAVTIDLVVEAPMHVRLGAFVRVALVEHR
jgi:hypothetical protein